jgi:hypothetical protein
MLAVTDIAAASDITHRMGGEIDKPSRARIQPAGLGADIVLLATGSGATATQWAAS